MFCQKPEKIDFIKTFFFFQVVTDPELAAKRKIAKQAKKKGSKKRKMEKIKKKMIVTRIKKDLDLDEY